MLFDQPKMHWKKAFTVRSSNTYYLQYLLAVRHCVTPHAPLHFIPFIGNQSRVLQMAIILTRNRQIERDLLHFFFIQYSSVCREFNVSASITVFFFVTCLQASLNETSYWNYLIVQCPLSLEVHERKQKEKSELHQDKGSSMDARRHCSERKNCAGDASPPLAPFSKICLPVSICHYI